MYLPASLRLQPASHSLRWGLMCSLCLALGACGGASSDSGNGANTSSSSRSVGSSPSSSASAPSSSSAPPSSSSSSTTSSSSSVAGVAAALAAKLGRPSRLLVGLGTQSDGNTVADITAAITATGYKIDIYDEYLGTGDWTTWNAPPCDYVCVVAKDADSFGAIPMFTYYQMANDGQDNMTVINDVTFMTTYWSNLKLLYTDIATYGKPVLVNLEPDFWGFTENAAPNADPSQVPAQVTINPDCASLTDDVTGIAGCMILMARKYAPNAYLGFPPSTWGGSSTAAVVAWMNKIGAQNADFLVEQTLDRDAGCFEVNPQPSYCTRSGSGWYWDETNTTHPDFTDYLTTVQQYQSGIGDLPVIFWQTPEGVPSSIPGGTPNHYRDDRMDYFLKHPDQLTAVGGLGVVFSGGESHQTSITTDGGQFQTLFSAYMSSPQPLP